MEVWFYSRIETAAARPTHALKPKEFYTKRSSRAPQESFCPLDKDLSWKSAFSVIELLVIVAPQAHLYGMSRMYSILTEATRRVQVVRTMEEAYSLLGVSSPQFSRISESAASGQ